MMDDDFIFDGLDISDDLDDCIPWNYITDSVADWF